MGACHNPGMGKREQKKAHTRTTLAAVALRLFTERGYDNVTVAEVAAEAQVSRRTAFRYFASKEDLVMQHPAEWLVVLDESLQAHRERELFDRIGIAAHAVAEHIEANPAAVRQLYGLAFMHPAVAGRYAMSSRLWIDRVAEEIHRDVTDETMSRMLAAAVLGIVNTVGEAWAATDQPMGPLLDSGLGLIAHPLTAPDGTS